MTVPAAHLRYLEIGSENPRRLARWYGEALGMAIERDARSFMCRGPERHIVISPGTSRTLLSVGYAVADRDGLAELRERLSRGEVALQAGRSGNADSVSFRDPDENRVEFEIEEAGSAAMDGMRARLQHVVFATRSIHNMVKFYTQVVGYRETDQVVDEQGILKTSFLRSNHEHHSLAFFQASEAKLDHHCYEAGDWGLIRDWGDHFSKHGIPVRWGPGRHGPGNNLFMFVHDADGNWVEISAELETVGPERTIGIWPHEELTLNKWGSAFLRG